MIGSTLRRPKNSCILCDRFPARFANASLQDALAGNLPPVTPKQIDGRSEKMGAQGVEIVEGDLSDFDSVSTALKGVSGAYYMYPIQVPGILEGTAIFAQAAIEEGVGSI